jgi:hypothetical protein
MTDEEALLILQENRPNKPTKAKGKKLQAAIDYLTESYGQEERITRSQPWATLGRELEGDKIIFYDGIFNIITETGRSKHLVVCGEFDAEVSLDYFRKKYKAVIVIYEQDLHGVIYRYGNHGDFWESIGTTIGYA